MAYASRPAPAALLACVLILDGLQLVGASRLDAGAQASSTEDNRDGTEERASSIYGMRNVRLRSNVSSIESGSLAHPPLEGCAANYAYTTCCCLVDYGILKQKTCECASSAPSCAKKAKLRNSRAPRRAFELEPGHEKKWWDSFNGYWYGYYAVEEEYCQATPVVDPQVDAYERSYGCTCSKAVGGLNVNLECGSSCGVADCKRTNPRALDWAPFESGRGKCCESGYSSIGGCPDTPTQITEETAQGIVKDAFGHAAYSGNRLEAFVFDATKHYIEDTKASFAKGARAKKMSTSRSGAQFFFSKDYKYILKSIHPAEYTVLHNIRSRLDTHVKHALARESQSGTIGHCQAVTIGEGHSSAGTRALSADFFGDWLYDETMMVDGRATLLHPWSVRPGRTEWYRAAWCKAAAEWRFVDKEDSLPVHHCDKDRDVAFQALLHQGVARSEAEREYSDFASSFAGSVNGSSKGAVVGRYASTCKDVWYPASLINDFVLGFTFGDSTWMIIRNSVAPVETKLKEAGFSNFYKMFDTFDVKPKPIHSDERAKLFGMHFIKDSSLLHWKNGNSVRRNLENDIQFMDSVLDDPLVDYSFFISVFYLKDERSVLDEVSLPNCIEGKFSQLDTYTEEAKGSILMCFSIIDMLMEFTFSKSPENLILFGKWSNWGAKFLTMFGCLDRDHPGCSDYKEYYSRYAGVDVDTVLPGSSARYEDATPLFDENGVVAYKDAKTQKDIGYKCCCNPGTGTCQLADLSKQTSTWFWESSTGCGTLVGSGWHNFQSEAKQCFLPFFDAEELYGLASGGRSYEI